jgi:hypothetical protein
MPSPFFMSGMSKNQYNSPDPIQTSTYKTSHGFSNAKSQAQQAYFTSNNNQYKYNENMRSNPIKQPPPGYSSFGYSPSSNISSAQLFSSAPTPFQKSASNIRPPTSNQTAFQASLMLKEMQRNMQKQLQEQLARQASNQMIIDNIQKIFPNLNNNNNNNNTNNSTNNTTTTTTTNNQITAIVPVEVSSAPVETKYEPVLSNKEAKETSFQNNNELKAIDENKENRYYEKLHKEPTYSDLYQKISDSNKMTEDIRTKIDYLYQNNIPKSNKNTKKSLTISPVVYTTDGYEYLDQQYSSVRPKSEEDIYDSSNRNITMINNTIKDINHKIRKIKKSSKTRS